MKRIHLPNLFFIQGQPHQGKSSLTRFFRQSLDCEVLPTDQLFWRWCDRYHKKETRQVRVSLGRYFPFLPINLRREWFEYLTNYTLSVTKYAKPDMVIEGWLLTLLPKDLKLVLYSRTNILNVTMRRFVAHTSRKSFRPVGADYTKVVEALKNCMRADQERELMPRVKRQRYEDCKSCSGRSDTAGRLAAFGLPASLANKHVLEIGCNTGYFAIRCAQRGATVYAVDTDEGAVRLSSRIANAIYRRPDIRFYRGNILQEDFRKAQKFDYILLLNGINRHQAPEQLFARAKQLLAPGGRVLAEVTLARMDNKHPDYARLPYYREVRQHDDVMRCPNDITVQSWCDSYKLVQRTQSVPTASNMLSRTAYTFQYGEDDGLGDRSGVDSLHVPDRPTEQVGLDPTTNQSDIMALFDSVPFTVGPHARIDCDCNTQSEELSALEIK
jgi:SAM-dependent methyltransferase